MPDPVAFVDLETTALDRRIRQVWEAALIVGEDEYVWHLPVDLSIADPMSLGMNGFHDRYNNWDTPPEDHAYYRREFAREFASLTRGLHLVGACVNFDEVSLWDLLRDNSECPMWHYHIVDTEALVAGLLGIPPPWSSTDLSLAVGVDPAKFDRHSALGDARWAKAMYEAVMAWKR